MLKQEMGLHNDKSMTKSIEHIYLIHGFSMSDSLYPFRLCKICDYDKSLDKVWHVEYYIWDIDKNAKVRKRVTLNEDTEKARYKRAKQLIAEIDAV